VEWLSSTLVALTVVVWFWGPGAAVAAWARLDGLALAAIAPVLTLGLFGSTALVAGAIGWRWSPWIPLTPVLIATAGWVLTRRVGSSPRGEAAARGGQPRRRYLVGSITVGIVAQLVPVGIGMGRPGRLLTAYDAVGHFSMVEYIRETGRASSLAISGMNTLDGSSQGFYGAAWHAVVATIWPLADAAVVFNIGFFVPAAAIWTIGLCYLAQSAFPARPRVWCWAAAMSASGVALPLYLALRPEGMIPNATAVALVPAYLGLVTSRDRMRTPSWLALVVLSTAGVGLTHPGALLASFLVLVPWALPRGLRAARRAWASPWGRVALVGLMSSAAVVLALLAGTERMRGVVAFTPESPLPWWAAAVNVLSGDVTGMGWASGFLVVALGVVGAFVSVRLPRAHWLVLANIVIVTTYLLATSSIPILNDVDRPWYGEPKRLAPVLAAVLIPLAAVALDSVPGWLRATGRLRSASPVRRDRLTIGILVIAMSTVPASIGTARLTQESFQGASQPPMAPVATDAELAMMHRLADELDRDAAVLGSPFSGASQLYGLNGQRMLLRSPFFEQDSARVFVTAHINELGSSPDLCRTLNELGVRYLYVKERSSDVLGAGLILDKVPAAGVRWIDSGGSASVYEITGC
jgi:hypothetical protein